MEKKLKFSALSLPFLVLLTQVIITHLLSSAYLTTLTYISICVTVHNSEISHWERSQSWKLIPPLQAMQLVHSSSKVICLFNSALRVMPKLWLSSWRKKNVLEDPPFDLKIENNETKIQAFYKTVVSTNVHWKVCSVKTGSMSFLEDLHLATLYAHTFTSNFSHR